MSTSHKFISISRARKPREIRSLKRRQGVAAARVVTSTTTITAILLPQPPRPPLLIQALFILRPPYNHPAEFYHFQWQPPSPLWSRGSNLDRGTLTRSSMEPRIVRQRAVRFPSNNRGSCCLLIRGQFCCTVLWEEEPLCG